MPGTLGHTTGKYDKWIEERSKKAQDKGRKILPMLKKIKKESPEYPRSSFAVLNTIFIGSFL